MFYLVNHYSTESEARTRYAALKFLIPASYMLQYNAGRWEIFCATQDRSI